MKRVIAAVISAGLFATAESAVAQQSQTYQYDVLGRLVGVYTTINGQPQVSTNYGYDYADNRTGVQTSGAPGGVQPAMARGATPATHAQTAPSAAASTPAAATASHFTPSQQAILAACANSSPTGFSAGCHQER